jgi:hypothetical protein
VTFTVAAFPNRQLSGTVSQIRPAPQTDEHAVTTEIVVSAPNPDLVMTLFSCIALSGSHWAACGIAISVRFRRRPAR